MKNLSLHEKERDEVLSSTDSRTPIRSPEEQDFGNSGESDLEEINADIPSAFKKHFSLLPTDLQNMFYNHRAAHKADMQGIKAGLHSLTNRLDQAKVIVQPVKLAITELQAAVVTQQATSQGLYTYVEDLDDREHRNNIPYIFEDYLKRLFKVS